MQRSKTVCTMRRAKLIYICIYIYISHCWRTRVKSNYVHFEHRQSLWLTIAVKAGMTKERSPWVQIDIASAQAECERSVDPRSVGVVDPRSVDEGDPLRREDFTNPSSGRNSLWSQKRLYIKTRISSKRYASVNNGSARNRCNSRRVTMISVPTIRWRRPARAGIE